MAGSPIRDVEVGAADLDAAWGIVSLVLSGGLDHAYEVDGRRFEDAAHALESMGHRDQAAALREVLSLTGGSPSETSVEDRKRRVAELDDRSAKTIDDLGRKFDEPDPLVAIEAVDPEAEP